MKNTILVIGASSAVAKEVIPVLSYNNKIITAGRKNCDIYCDISKQVDIPSRVDVVINFAAAFGGENGYDAINTINTNLLGTLNVCMAAKKAGIKQLVLISSIFALLNEKSPFYNFYSITKKQADELAAYYCKANKVPLAILRPSQIYGDSNDFAKHQPFFYQIVDKAQSGEDIAIYGSNDARRNYINCGDLAIIAKLVVTRKIEGIYSCIYPSNLTYSQIAKTAQRVFGKGGEVVFLKDKPNIPDNVFKNDLSLYKKIDFHPEISIEEGLSRIKEFREG